MLNFCMRGHDFEVNSIDALAEKCRQYGIYGVQLAMPKTMPDFKVGQFTPAYAVSMKEKLDAANAKVPVLGCYINPSCTNEPELKAQLDRFREQLKYAKFLNAFAVGTETGFVGDSCDPEANHTEEAYQHLLGNLRELVACAEKLGVMIAIEGVKIFVIDTPQKMRRLLDDLASPNVMCIFDPFNFIGIDNYQQQDKLIDDAFELCGDVMCAIHLKDFTVTDGKVCRVLPTEGMLNIERILRHVKASKPEMPIVLEEVKEAQLPQVMENVQRLYDTID